MGTEKPSKISVRLEAAPKERPGVFHETDFFIFNENSEKEKRWELFHKLPESKLVIAYTISRRNGKISVNGQPVTAAMEIDQPITPVIFTVQRIASNDERLVQYPFLENESQPKIIHPSFLEEPTFYYYVEPDKNNRFNYRLKFWDTTLRKLFLKKQGA